MAGQYVDIAFNRTLPLTLIEFSLTFHNGFVAMFSDYYDSITSDMHIQHSSEMAGHEELRISGFYFFFNSYALRKYAIRISFLPTCS